MKTFHWKVKFTRRGWEPPRPFGKTSEVVCAPNREAAKEKVNAAYGYKITATKTSGPVSFGQSCHCPTVLLCNAGYRVNSKWRRI